MSATELKAKCLALLDRLSRGELDQVCITKRGKVVAVITPPPAEPKPAMESLYGCLKGTFWIDPTLDLTEPIIELEDGHGDLPTDPPVGSA